MQLRRFALFLIPLALALGVSGFLFWGTRAADFERHAAVIESIQRERQLTTLLKQGVLAARFNLLTQYDPLTATENEAAEVRRLLGEQVKKDAAADPEISAALADLDRAMAEQRERVERFKSENAILKNSLYYLPTAGHALTGKLQKESGSAAVVQDVNALVQATLVHNLVGGEDRAAAVRALTTSLRERQHTVPEGARTSLQLLLAHSGKIQTQTVAVDPLVEKILANQVEDRLDQFERAYTQSFQRSVTRASRYRAALYAWSTVLLLGVIGAVAKVLSLYANLERLVKQRTEQLDSAMKALWGEMALAKKIQTALVPEHPQLSGCEVAAAMRPADEVGGDYYDVLRVQGVEWVLIGDVSGHGVPAGLVMMMCQTAVRTALERDPHQSPSELLSIVNRSLSANIKRLGEKKYMTMQALRRDGSGSFVVAGLHQDLLIYRARDGRVEEVRTRGVWLGILDEIGAMLKDDRVELGEGDVLLLFTDGITEAKRRDTMLDNAGLVKAFAGLGDKPAAAIVSGVLEVLADYEVDDDASLIVIRRQPDAAKAEPSSLNRAISGA